MFVILTFLFLLLSAWCFKYIVSVFWKVWYHCTWWDWSFDLISDRIRSSPGRGKKGILWENQSFFYVPWTVFDILGSIPCPTHAPAFASGLPEVDMWTSKPRMTAENVTQESVSFTHNFCQRTAWGLIPIAVNGELSNPLILIQQHALLTMVGAVGGVGRCDCTALPVLCCSPHEQGAHLGSAPVGPGPWELPTPPYCFDRSTETGSAEAPGQTQAPGSGQYPQAMEVLQERGALSAFSSRGCRAGLLKQGHFSWEKCMSSSRRKMHSMEGKGPFAARCLCGALGAVCPSPHRAWALTPLCWWCFTSVPGTTQAWGCSQGPAASPSLTWVRLSTAWMQRWHRPGQRLKWEPFKSFLLLWTKLSSSGKLCC